VGSFATNYHLTAGAANALSNEFEVADQFGLANRDCARRANFRN
jgi:hypothetical protein